MMRQKRLRGTVESLTAVLLVAVMVAGFSSFAWAKSSSQESQEEIERRMRELFDFSQSNCLQVFTTKPELDLGNVSPLRSIDKEGEDTFQLWVLSSNSWVKRIEWSNLGGVTGDDAEGKTISKDRIKAYLKVAAGSRDPLGEPPVVPPEGPPGQESWMEIPNGWMIEVPGSPEIDQEHFRVKFEPMWCDHAGSYSSTLTVIATQL